MDNRPVVFIDSGIGGIPYAHFFRSRNRGEKLYYAADRANFPYGRKTRENVIDLALSFAAELIARYDPKVLVLACNTMTVSALSALREAFPSLPFVGTVPAMKPALLASRKRCVGVLGTERTVEDPYVAELAARYGPDCAVISLPAPELVEFAEYRWLEAPGAERAAAVMPWVEKFKAEGADALVLACTHFLLLKEEFRNAGSGGLAIFDSLEGVCRRVESILDDEGGKLRSGLTKDAEDPVFTVTGKEPLESRWKQLCAYFGFTGENAGES